MALIPRLRSLWRNLIHRDRVERDLDDEIRGTIEALAEEHRQAGLAPDAARRAAVLQLGAPEAMKDRVRDVRAGALVESFVQDCRYGARVLRRNPVFTLAAALSLSVGIGATTTIFTVANGLLLRTAPGVPEPDRLVDIVPSQRGHFGVILTPYDTYAEIRERTTTVEDVYGYHLEPQPRSLRGVDGAERVFAGLVTPNYFTALRVPAALGRMFADDGRVQTGEGRPIVLSHGFWTRRFNADPAVIGRAVHLNGQPFVVTGVAGDGFRGLSIAAPDLWIPLDTEANQLTIGGRLKPGISKAQAAAELDAIGRALAQERPGPFASLDWTVALSSPLPAALRNVAALFIGLLMTLVSLVLVIACANVAGVLLARATARRREMAVRVAIGAGRARLVRQLVTETTLLFALGAVSGVALARLMTRLLLAALPAFSVPINLALPLDGRVLAFSLGLALAAALVSGLAPALHASRADVVTALKDETQGPSDRLRLRSLFVIAQVAVSILLVIAAGLLGRALGRVSFADQGFDPNGVSIASADLSMAGYSEAEGRRFISELRHRARGLPGVHSATVAHRLPGGPIQIESSVRERGVAAPAPAAVTPASWMRVEPGYFATLRIPLVAGRDFKESDTLGAQPVVVVDESTARRLWPGQDAVGQYLPTSVRSTASGSAGPPLVIGVVRDVKSAGRSREVSILCIYAPLQQLYSPRVTVLARSDAGAPTVAALRSLITVLDPDLAVLAAHTLADAQAGPVVLQLRIATLVSGSVGLIGLLLAAIGIYGVTA